MTEFDQIPEQSPTDIEIAAAIAVENNPEIFTEESSRESLIEKVKSFAGGIAIALGTAEKDGPLNLH